MYYIGSHVSIAGGFMNAAKKAKQIGANAFQYFPKNPRSLAVKAIDVKDTVACNAYCREHDLLAIAHAPYPTNLATHDERLRSALIPSLLNDLSIAEACGSIGVVVHFGKYIGKDALQGYKNVLRTLDEVLHQWEGQAMVLLENQAGERGMLGSTLEELVQIRSLCARPECVGFCLDTCHAFASGLWTGSNWEAITVRGTELGFFAHLKAVHMNDSLFPSGSGRDRHANIGEGYIGTERFRQFIRSSFIRNIPIVLETPTAAKGTHSAEIAMIREWVEAE